MAREIRARFSNGKLEPLEPIDLAEGEEIVVTIAERGERATPMTDALKALADAWDGIVDLDALERNIAEGRRNVSVRQVEPPRW